MLKLPLQILFNNINHGYRAVISKENSLGLLPFYMATYGYYEKVHRMMHIGIVLYFLKE